MESVTQIRFREGMIHVESFRDTRNTVPEDLDEIPEHQLRRYI